MIIHPQHSSRNQLRRRHSRTTRVTPPLVALHITPNGEGLPTTRMRAVEGFLARVRVRMDAQTGRAGEGLVAGAADVAVGVLLVGGCAGGGEVVVVLVLVWPGRGDGGDEGW